MEDESGLALIKLREKAGKTQEEVAADLDTEQTVISKHERGIIRIGRRWLERYADYYGVSTDVIAGRRTEALPAIYPPGPLATIYVYGTVRAGEPMLACEDIRDYETVDKKTYQEGDLYLEVEGDSMEPDFIPAGGFPLADIADFLGHAQKSTSLIYTHASAANQTRAAEILAASLPPKIPPTSKQNTEIEHKKPNITDSS